MVEGPYCAGCVQQPIGVKRLSHDGRGTAGIMLVGDSPWLEEMRFSRVFVGASGRLLDAQIKRCGLQREDFTIYNSMQCKPPFLGWTDKHPDAALAIQHCRPYLDDLIKQMQPKVIVTLGGIAMQRVIGVSGIINRQAYIHDTPYGIPAVPTFHPSYILQGNHKMTQALFFALQRAVEVAKAGGHWYRAPVEYLADPPPDLARSYLFNSFIQSQPRTGEGEGEARLSPSPEQKTAAERGVAEWVTRTIAGGWQPRIPLLACDIETPNSAKLDEEDAEDDPSFTIVRISFSVSEHTALSIPWQEPYISIAKEALAAAAVTVFWNGDGFDIPRLRANGCGWQGEVHDAMWMWHFLQSDMLKGLGFVAPFFCDLPPWKHLSDADPPYYSCCDADATFRCYVAIRRALESQGRWQRFVRHCIRAGEIFRLPHVGRINVDHDVQARLLVRLEQERDAAVAKLQSEVPDAIKPTKVYKRQPSEEKLASGHFHVIQRECDCRKSKAEDVPANVEVEL